MAETVTKGNPIEPLFGGYSPGTGTGSQLELALSNIVGVMTLIAGLAFLFYFFLGALNWITSAGDTQKAQKARQYISNALMGLVIAVAAYGIIYVLGTVLGIEITLPSSVLNSLL